MKRPDSYHTRQREAVLRYFESLDGEHVTAAQVLAHCHDKGVPMGRTTVYRLLEKLTESGRLRRYTQEGIPGACYQYAENPSACREHFHLKCEACGTLLHLECAAMGDIHRHIQEAHAFRVNALRTVLYGVCGSCIQDRP